MLRSRVKPLVSAPRSLDLMETGTRTGTRRPDRRSRLTPVILLSVMECRGDPPDRGPKLHSDSARERSALDRQPVALLAFRPLGTHPGNDQGLFHGRQVDGAQVDFDFVPRVGVA